MRKYVLWIAAVFFLGANLPEARAEMPPQDDSIVISGRSGTCPERVKVIVEYGFHLSVSAFISEFTHDAKIFSAGTNVRKMAKKKKQGAPPPDETGIVKAKLNAKFGNCSAAADANQDAAGLHLEFGNGEVAVSFSRGAGQTIGTDVENGNPEFDYSNPANGYE